MQPGPEALLLKFLPLLDKLTQVPEVDTDLLTFTWGLVV